MRKSFIIAMAVFTFCSNLSYGNSELTFRTFSPLEKKYIEVKVIDVNGVNVSASCLKKGKLSCDAITALENKVARDVSSVPALGNPAARYCLDHKGSNRIFFNSKKQEFDFCMFPDASFVNAWQLYRKHQVGEG